MDDDAPLVPPNTIPCLINPVLHPEDTTGCLLAVVRLVQECPHNAMATATTLLPKIRGLPIEVRQGLRTLYDIDVSNNMHDTYCIDTIFWNLLEGGCAVGLSQSLNCEGMYRTIEWMIAHLDMYPNDAFDWISNPPSGTCSLRHTQWNPDDPDDGLQMRYLFDILRRSSSDYRVITNEWLVRGNVKYVINSYGKDHPRSSEMVVEVSAGGNEPTKRSYRLYKPPHYKTAGCNPTLVSTVTTACGSTTTTVQTLTVDQKVFDLIPSPTEREEDHIHFYQSIRHEDPRRSCLSEFRISFKTAAASGEAGKIVAITRHRDRSLHDDIQVICAYPHREHGRVDKYSAPAGMRLKFYDAETIATFFMPPMDPRYEKRLCVKGTTYDAPHCRQGEHEDHFGPALSNVTFLRGELKGWGVTMKNGSIKIQESSKDALASMIEVSTSRAPTCLIGHDIIDKPAKLVVNSDSSDVVEPHLYEIEQLRKWVMERGTSPMTRRAVKGILLVDKTEAQKKVEATVVRRLGQWQAWYAPVTVREGLDCCIVRAVATRGKLDQLTEDLRKHLKDFAAALGQEDLTNPQAICDRYAEVRKRCGKGRKGFVRLVAVLYWHFAEKKAPTEPVRKSPRAKKVRAAERADAGH